MAWPVLVGELLEQRRATFGEDGSRGYTRVFVVETDSAQWGALAVASVVGVVRGDSYVIGTVSDEWYEYDTYVRCNLIEPAQAAVDGCTWHVTVGYGVMTAEEAADDPTELPYSVSFDGEEREEICDIDRDGNPVVNKARDPFDPPVVRDASRSILVIERNEGFFDETWATYYRDSVNQDVFTIVVQDVPRAYAAGTVLCKKIGATIAFSPEIGLYWKVRYEFQINPDGWAREPLNAGMRRIRQSLLGPTHAPILVDGVPVSEPVPLDNAGDVLGPTGTPIYLEFHVFAQRLYGVMGF